MSKFKIIIEIGNQRLSKVFDWDESEEELEKAVRESIIIRVVK